MNRNPTFLSFIFLFIVAHGFAQTNPVIDVFPKGTIIHGNIPYNNDDLPKHLLDIYLPAKPKGSLPQDCNRAVSFLFDKTRIAVMGFSAGGHLASLMGLSRNNKDDPPFLIIHGEKDDLVSVKQSQLLSSRLNVAGVQNELIIVKDAPHFGVMFDTDDVRNKVLSFLKKELK